MLIRESLLCIINMIKTIVDGYSQVKYPFLLILNENKFSEVFASYIWKYTDKELN